MKKMTAAVVAFAMVACVSVAMAEDEAVDIYGKIHVSVDQSDSGSDDSQYLNSNSSRIGFKGSSDISESLKLIWQMECGVNLDESGSALASRNSFVGVKCDKGGKLVVGYHDSPFKSIGRKVDFLGDRVGDTRNIIGITDCGCDLRLKNVVLLSTPSFKGVQGAVAYVPNEDGDQTAVVSASVLYKNEGLLAGAAYESHGKGMTMVDTDADGTADAISEEAESAIRAVASYAWGDFKVGGLFEAISNAEGTDGADRNTWGLGASYKVTDKDTVKVQYYSTDGVDGIDDAGSAMLGAAVDHKLTDKTMVYVTVAAMSNDDMASLRVTGGGHGDKVTPVAGDDPWTASVGLIHLF